MVFVALEISAADQLKDRVRVENAGGTPVAVAAEDEGAVVTMISPDAGEYQRLFPKELVAEGGLRTREDEDVQTVHCASVPPTRVR